MLLTMVPDISQIAFTGKHNTMSHCPATQDLPSASCVPGRSLGNASDDSARVKLGAGLHVRHQLRSGSETYSSGCLCVTSGAAALA